MMAEKKSYPSIIQENLELYKRGQMQVLEMGDNVADGVIVADENGYILGANALVCAWMKVPEEVLLHQPITILQGQITDAIRITLAERKTATAVFWQDITQKQILLTSSPFFDRKGRFLCVVAVLRDLSDILELSSQLRILDNERNQTQTELAALKNKYISNALVGDSRVMLQLKSAIAQVAKTTATVLIQGETGTGKEIAARELHKQSERAGRPFVTVNCAAIPESLLESELFGYARGAFTGASAKDKRGLFEEANGGTLLLDEIGDMPVQLQTKLLRVLQEREILRVGATKPIKIDVRFLAATHQDIEAMVSEKRFRQDLYYRLNAVNIVMPPLRERKDDIGLLTDSILTKMNRKYDKNCTLDIRALFALEHHDWPGNVRELENVIERLVLFGKDTIPAEQVYSIINVTKKHFPYDNRISMTESSLKAQVEELERTKIVEALSIYKTTRKAAAALGMSQSGMMRKIKALDIQNWKQG
ncbi:MAG: sigma 54-interacting transcriptional regulator [Oscillospiraceae bacterium]|nr:sigma 54-interacting transcriptional regulator [Oscillospiraceae bacterium]